ncbi:hypothetical protein CDAR_195891 [Caerostris darwini]|uniref:Uncharacterized protein n=1 Tax=Caerostris darwini TaxID=1538125 RepID=A0AAV4WS96_9ARAC|nr:hypothetical protein CDAR_195891 [Caerostris darwini]
MVKNGYRMVPRELLYFQKHWRKKGDSKITPLPRPLIYVTWVVCVFEMPPRNLLLLSFELVNAGSPFRSEAKKLVIQKPLVTYAAEISTMSTSVGTQTNGLDSFPPQKSSTHSNTKLTSVKPAHVSDRPSTSLSLSSTAHISSIHNPSSSTNLPAIKGIQIMNLSDHKKKFDY